MKTIFDFIKAEENNYQTQPTHVMEGWDWLMPEHIKRSIAYKFSRFLDAKQFSQPFKNIILKILRVRYRTEGIDVKDVNLFINSKENNWKSFLLKKAHEKYAREYNVDEFIDEMSETDIDIGGVLVKDVNAEIPEVIPWQRVAFCDTTDILSSPICEKHQYTPDQLVEMIDYHWGDSAYGATMSIEELITLAENAKTTFDQSKQINSTPGKYIEVYELHGVLPRFWLDDSNENSIKDKYIRQHHIIAYYKDSEGNNQGVTLFKMKENKNPYKFRTDKIFNRAIGLGGVEELFEPQIWTNYGMIRMQEMLDAASKVYLQTSDTRFTTKNKIAGAENLEVFVTEEGKSISQIDTTPRSINLFNNAVAQWEVHANEISASTEALSGKQPSSGTPFKLQELLVDQSMGWHEFRQGKFIKFVEEIYRDWLIPRFIKKIVNGDEFLSELSLDELNYAVEGVVTNRSNKYFAEKVLRGDEIQEGEQEAHKEKIRTDFLKTKKKFIKILKDEFKGLPIDIEININGKQKDIARMTDKTVNIIRQVIASPQILQVPGMADLFNQIIEYSGLNPIDFSGLTKQQPPAQPQQQVAQGGATTEPLVDLTKSLE